VLECTLGIVALAPTLSLPLAPLPLPPLPPPPVVLAM
jgi:hypothetical protein